MRNHITTKTPQDKSTASTRKAGIAAAFLLLICALCIAPVAAGNISIDTTGLTGKMTDTILVPVVITDPKEVCAWQLEIDTGDRADAKVVFNRDSVMEAGATSSESIIYWTETDRSKYISSDKTLFYLAVTPKIEGEIPLTIKNIAVGESDNRGYAITKPYGANSAYLHVSGMGSGQTIGDSESGATVFMGVMKDGYLSTGSKTSLRSIRLADNGDITVTIFWNTCKPYDPPQTFNVAEKFTISTSAADGTPMQLEIGVSKKWVEDNGKTAEDLLVLRNLGGKWFNTKITSITEDGDVYVVTIDSWYAGSPFIIGFETDEKTTYEMETLDLVLHNGKLPGFAGIPLAAIIGGIAGLLIIAAGIITIIIIKKRGKKVTIQYHANGGTGDWNITVKKGTETLIGEGGTVERAGYTFNGWWTEPEGGTQITGKLTVISDMTLYAHWTQTTEE